MGTTTVQVRHFLLLPQLERSRVETELRGWHSFCVRVTQRRFLMAPDWIRKEYLLPSSPFFVQLQARQIDRPTNGSYAVCIISAQHAKFGSHCIAMYCTRLGLEAKIKHCVHRFNTVCPRQLFHFPTRGLMNQPLIQGKSVWAPCYQIRFTEEC